MSGPRVGVLLAVALSVLVAACSATPGGRPREGGGLAVVAAEDFWGSIARAVGGTHVDVESVIVSPDIDPHAYEPTPHDARAIASARLVITNGIGYDSWTDALLAANPVHGRIVLNVGQLVGLKSGDNPHQWYSVSTVEKVIDALVADYSTLDADHASEYARLRDQFDTVTLASYHSAIQRIRADYRGTAVGASESIFTPLAESLGLTLKTPASFLTAISEGNEPSASDKSQIDRQIATKAIEVFVFNSQNATPDVRRLVEEARSRGIPVATVTETMTPPGTTFWEWQTRQLLALEAALASASEK